MGKNPEASPRRNKHILLLCMSVLSTYIQESHNNNNQRHLPTPAPVTSRLLLPLLLLRHRLAPVHEVHLQVQVQRAVLELAAHARAQHLDLLAAPTQDAREGRQRVRADGLDLLQLLVAAQFLELGVLGPGADWELVDRLAKRELTGTTDSTCIIYVHVYHGMGATTNLQDLTVHVLETRVYHAVLQRADQAHALAELLARQVQVLEEDLAVLGLLVRPVVRVEPRVRRLHLEPAAVLQVLERLGEEVVPVGDEAHQLTAVDVVERAVVEPFVLEVVDLEGAVWWDPMHVRMSTDNHGSVLHPPLGLYGTQVRACDC